MKKKMTQYDKKLSFLPFDKELMGTTTINTAILHWTGGHVFHVGLELKEGGKGRWRDRSSVNTWITHRFWRKPSLLTLCALSRRFRSAVHEPLFPFGLWPFLWSILWLVVIHEEREANKNTFQKKDFLVKSKNYQTSLSPFPFLCVPPLYFHRNMKV